MKKKILILIIIMCFVLVGCNNNSSENKSSSNAGNNNIESDNTNVSSDNTQKNDGSLSISKVKKIYTDDLPLGFENNFLTVNGKDVVVRVQTTGSSQQQSNGPYYVYYEVYVGNDSDGHNCVREGIYHLEGYGIEMLKGYTDEDIGTNYEFFEGDFTSSILKSDDKEYVAISLPAGTEDKNQSSLMITTDSGILLSEFITDVVHDITLTGQDVEKYRNFSGDIVFNSIKDGNITYLTPTAEMYIVDSNGNKVLNNSLDEIELEEHSVGISNDKVTDIKTSNIYRITNATGKIFNFSEFRH